MGVKWVKLLQYIYAGTYVNTVGTFIETQCSVFTLLKSMFILPQPTGVWGKYLELQFR